MTSSSDVKNLLARKKKLFCRSRLHHLFPPASCFRPSAFFSTILHTHTHIITHLQARKSSQAIFRGSTRHRAQRRTSAAQLMTTVALSYAGEPLAGYYGSTVTMWAVSDSFQQPQDKRSVSERSLLTGFSVRADRMTVKNTGDCS